MPRFILGALIVLFSVVCSSPAQNAASTATSEKESPPIQISDNWQIASHRLSEAEPLRVTNPRSSFGGIQVKVVVDELGNVVSAKIAETNPLAPQPYKDLYPTALAQAGSWKYKPFEKDGKPVAATFTDYIRILPPEDLPTMHVPFPQIKDLKSLRITLERTTCFGSCPAYRVEIGGDGSVAYQGRGYVVVTGEHHDHISKDSLRQILEAFRKADYFSLRDKYIYGVTDNPTTTTSISFDGQQKSVIDYVGEEAGMPHAVVEVEETIDRVAGTARWVSGSAETVPSLMRENWDFKSQEAGLTLVRAACDPRRSAIDGTQALVDLVSAGVPPDVHDSPSRSALGCMARQKDQHAVTLLMEAGAARNNPEIKNEALTGAALAGDLQLVRLMLKYGADPNAAGHDGETALMAAAASGKSDMVAEILKYHPDVNARGPGQQTALYFASKDMYFRGAESERETWEKQRAEVVVMLLKAGADPHLADKDGNTPLHKADSLAIAEALIKNGADVNARNNQGETPLMKTYSDDVVRLLVQSGANISSRDNEGHTVMDNNGTNWSRDKIKLLQSLQSASPGKAEQ